MKAVVLLVLLAAAAAMYFGYEPYDLVTIFQPTQSSPPVKHSHVPTEQVATAPPIRDSNGSILVVGGPDGSLQERWSPYPKVSPTAVPGR